LSSESEDPQIRQCAHDAYRAIIDPLKKDLEVAIRHGLARNIDPELAICGLIGLAESIINRAACDDCYTIQEIDEMIIDFTERAFSAAQNHSYSQALPADRHVFSASITDRHGLCSDVSELQFDGSATLRGILGQAEIEVEPARVNSIIIREANEGWFADVTTRDGVQASLQVQPNLIISGKTPLGTLRIALSDTSAVAFSDPQR